MKKVVTIGWWTWTYNLLRALKPLEVNINAIVSMSDDWWSTGVLRDEYWVLPPWDLRRALVALAKDEDTVFLRKLFNFRFKWWSFDGHNLGNLIMLAASEIEGDFWKAINKLEELFDVKGKIYPATFEKTRIVAQLENGEIIIWETNIDVPKHDWNLRIKNFWVVKEEYAKILNSLKQHIEIPTVAAAMEDVLKQANQDRPNANPKVKEILVDADYIIIWPGDLFTSVLPNILVNDIAYYLKKSKAQKILMVNIFTKYGETAWFKLSDFLNEFKKYMGSDIFDIVIAQDPKLLHIPTNLINAYKEEGKELVIPDIQDSRVVLYDLISQKDFIRHDALKTRKVLKKLLNF